LTFAMARHAVVDLAQVFNTPPPAADRLAQADLQWLRESLRASGLALREGGAAERRLAELRPQVRAVCERARRLPVNDTSALGGPDHNGR
jgi:hypothetical protein